MRIAVLDDYLGVSGRCADWSRLEERGEVVVFDRPLAVPDEAVAALGDFDIICTLRERMAIPASLIERLPRLKYIVVTGKRYDTVDVAAASRHGVLVSNTPIAGRGSDPVVELVWGMLLALARNITLEDRNMRAGGWQSRVGISVRGRTLGIVGLGNIGSRVARWAEFFGMRVLAWSSNLTPEAARDAGAVWVSKDNLFRQSDFVTIHLPLSARTREIVTERELGLMKSTAYLINTSRGEIVREDALIQALDRKTIAGAALDVFRQEPLPGNHPLRRLNNAVLTPHIGYFTQEMLEIYYGDAVKAIHAFLDGNPINLVSCPSNG